MKKKLVTENVFNCIKVKQQKSRYRVSAKVRGGVVCRLAVIYIKKKKVMWDK